MKGHFGTSLYYRCDVSRGICRDVMSGSDGVSVWFFPEGAITDIKLTQRPMIGQNFYFVTYLISRKSFGLKGTGMSGKPDLSANAAKSFFGESDFKRRQ